MDALEANARIGIGCQLLEPLQGVGYPGAPVAKYPRGRGPGAEVMRSEQAIQQLEVDDIVELVGPEGLQQVVFVVDVVLSSSFADFEGVRERPGG